MRTLIGNVGAFVLFAAFFALHIVGGASDQGWLFNLAVVLILLTATGFPVVASLLARSRDRATLALGFVVGSFLTGGALWAANDRSMAWWIVPVAPARVALVCGVGLWLLTATGRGTSAPAARPGRASGERL
jgi:hypothetical protein